jgi:hypothetical protein
MAEPLEGCQFHNEGIIINIYLRSLNLEFGYGISFYFMALVVFSSKIDGTLGISKLDSNSIRVSSYLTDNRVRQFSVFLQ